MKYNYIGLGGTANTFSSGSQDLAVKNSRSGTTHTNLGLWHGSRATVTYLLAEIFRCKINAILLIAAPTMDAELAAGYGHAAQATAWILERICGDLKLTSRTNYIGDYTWEVFLHRFEVLFHEIVDGGVFRARGSLRGNRGEAVHEGGKLRPRHGDIGDELLFEYIAKWVVHVDAERRLPVCDVPRESIPPALGCLGQCLLGKLGGTIAPENAFTCGGLCVLYNQSCS